jgi:hypothetical protein
MQVVNDNFLHISETFPKLVSKLGNVSHFGNIVEFNLRNNAGKCAREWIVVLQFSASLGNGGEVNSEFDYVDAVPRLLRVP